MSDITIYCTVKYSLGLTSVFAPHDITCRSIVECSDVQNGVLEYTSGPCQSAVVKPRSSQTTRMGPIGSAGSIEGLTRVYIHMKTRGRDIMQSMMVDP